MFILKPDESFFIALFLEGFLYGIYTGIFAMYLQSQASKPDINKAQKILLYSMCTLYVSSALLLACDIAYTICIVRFINQNLWMLPILILQTTLFACCDFIAQFILIYRCWIVWGCNIRIVILPSILAFTFLGIWIASNRTIEGSSRFGLSYLMTLTGLALSLTVNALVTGFILFRIFAVFRKVRATSDDKILSATGGSKLRPIILIIIESAMALFSIQLARLMVNISPTETASTAFNIIVTIHQTLNGITPTIIMVRTSMGFSFHDEKSMEEFAIGSLRFASNHSSSVPETDIRTMMISNEVDIDIIET